jgi:carotenoid cleavage dioxygenase-like enzyme
MMQAVGAVGLVSTASARRAGAEVPKAPPTDDPFLSGYYAPIHSESEEPDLKIDGDMPKALHGTLYRNGPNPQFAPRGPYHWFDGDGMIHAFHFENGRVSYLNRWVRTPKWPSSIRPPPTPTSSGTPAG